MLEDSVEVGMKNTITWFKIEDQIRFGMSTSAKTRQNEPT
jgi:hypothetical protein